MSTSHNYGKAAVYTLSVKNGKIYSRTATLALKLYFFVEADINAQRDFCPTGSVAPSFWAPSSRESTVRRIYYRGHGHMDLCQHQSNVAECADSVDAK